MMDKLNAILNLFKSGESVANPKNWANGQITATTLVPVLISANEVAKSYGWNIPLNDGALYGAAVLILWIVNVVITIISRKDVGLRSKPPADNNTGSGSSGEPGPN